MTLRRLTLTDIDPHWADGENPRWRLGTALGQPGGMAVPVAEIFVHHTVSADTGDVVRDVAGPCDTDQRNFGKLSYSWNVHLSTATVVEVEGTHRGAHTINNAQQSLNGISFGFGVIGNFHPTALNPPPRRPTDSDIEIIAEAIVEMVVTPGLVIPEFVIKGHRDAPYATACCGDWLYERLPDIRAAVERLSTTTPRKVDKVNALITGDNDPAHTWYLTDYVNASPLPGGTPANEALRTEIIAEVLHDVVQSGGIFARDPSSEQDQGNGRLVGSKPLIRTQALVDALK